MILVDQTAVPLAVPELIRRPGRKPLDEGPLVLTANILPLAAFMVLGGRLGDLLGLRRVFLHRGPRSSSYLRPSVGLSQDTIWAIAARFAQGTGAALMMPTALAITSSVFPQAERGRALGILAGASAFFAASGPVLGGVLTQHRLAPRIPDQRAPGDRHHPADAALGAAFGAGARRHRAISTIPGVATLGLGWPAIIFGLTQGAGKTTGTSPR